MITGFGAVSTIYSSLIASSSKGTAASQASSTTPAGTRDFSLVAEDARAVLDAQYQDAQKNGKNITFDSSKPGVPLDLSSLSDRAVAAIALNKDGLFTDLEVAQAGGYLSGQLQAVLAPSFKASNGGDLRPVATEYLNLFDQLDPEVKQALGMTDEQRLAAESILRDQEKQYGKLSPEEGFPGFIQLLRQMAEEWKQSHPDGYNAQGASYYTSVSNSRSFTI
ncbi:MULTISPECIES: hypothetical protein [unclassified Rhizobium]|jgi:hypothetical protein|uniref:hypothetical protein n=1 Tax=unclassified Rhizobium TaxID=2613769 RepID=UPI0006492772|nr:MULTISPECIES: hypothetical protein [unclassified Rhizobium]MBN8954328.1 hypothetical protein [Rhizobium tropici]OJY79090.1 MAG: hypothetical protein BGP09_24695 [Rhizobium sp. 60-20]RKD67829.1 hypothetical protein BJ928_105232 [Rhizobium sp. WW_1]